MPVTQNIAPVTINFTDTSSGDSLSYLWNFGDGGTSTQANPTHTFLAGVWEVTRHGQGVGHDTCVLPVLVDIIDNPTLWSNSVGLPKGPV